MTKAQLLRAISIELKLVYYEVRLRRMCAAKRLFHARIQHLKARRQELVQYRDTY
jgi:hypothetical protein